jgi:hypothetical protein
MQTNLAPEYQNTPDGLAAEATSCWAMNWTARVAASI